MTLVTLINLSGTKQIKRLFKRISR